MKTLLRLHLMIRSNWISSTGAALMTLAALAFLTFWAFSVFGTWQGPYVGILMFVAMPLVFLGGLLLVPIGLVLFRKQLRRRVQALADKPVYLARAVVILTLINFAGVGTVGYTSVEFVSSTQFCGTACHSVMQPEYDTYVDSPHCRVDCVECHVGPGAKAFVTAKLNGVKQMIGTIRDNYSRPIPTPVHNLRPASETCENCHWPEKYLGTKLLVRPHFRDDEAVSSYTDVLLMRTGGTGLDGKSTGIHWHVHPTAVVEYYATDEKRTTIPWVRVRKPGEPDQVFVAEGAEVGEPPPGELRRMDCNDCHNRSAHEFMRAPDAVDAAIAAGLISRQLPSIRKFALEALHLDVSRDQAADAIRRHLQKQYASRGQLDEDARQRLETATETLVKIWMRNVYPDRKLTWDSYPSMKTHDGCYRCHDDRHKTADGKTITKRCDACHVVLSEQQEDPAILDSLGLGQRR